MDFTSVIPVLGKLRKTAIILRQEEGRVLTGRRKNIMNNKARYPTTHLSSQDWETERTGNSRSSLKQTKEITEAG